MVLPYQLVGQRLVQVRDDVLDIFDSYRDPHQAIGNSEPCPTLRANCSVGHRRRMADQCLHAAQRLGQERQLQPLGKGVRLLQRLPSSIEIIDPKPLCCRFASSCCG